MGVSLGLVNRVMVMNLSFRQLRVTDHRFKVVEEVSPWGILHTVPLRFAPQTAVQPDAFRPCFCSTALWCFG